MSYYFALNPRKYYYRIKQSTETGLIFKIMNPVTEFNPIPAGVLENQDTLGGGQFDPPPLNPMFYVQI